MRAALAAALLLAVPAAAHDGQPHATRADAATHAAAPPAQGLPLPFDLGGAFTLTDQSGQPRSEADPQGRMQLLFFGYANCDSICSVALPVMAEVADRLAASDIAVTPVMVTVDPERDTPATIGAPLARLHPDFVGLTGSDADLAKVYDLFAVEKQVVFHDPSGAPVYAHGSNIYLLDGEGRFLTLLPPILSADRMEEIAAGFALKMRG